VEDVPHGRQTAKEPAPVHRQFKRDAVDLVRTTGRPIAEIAQELGVCDSTLGNWVRQDRIDRGEAEGLTTEERARLRQLEAEVDVRCEPGTPHTTNRREHLESFVKYGDGWS
jgi:transposase-like protein